MSTSKISLQMDHRLEMSTFAGARDRFYISERSGLGRSCRKMEMIHPVCKKWLPLSSNQRSDRVGPGKGTGAALPLIEQKADREIHSYV